MGISSVRWLGDTIGQGTADFEANATNGHTDA